MSSAAVLLLAIFAASPSDAGGDIPAATWTADQVAQQAGDHAPLARALEAERIAVARGVDRDDPAACAQMNLIRSVYQALAEQQRNDSAAEARTAYWRAVAAAEQSELLDQAAPLLDSLDALAATAERLGLNDDNPDELADQRLQMEERWYEADFSQRRLRNQLSGLTGLPLTDVNAATFSDRLPMVASSPRSAEGEASLDREWDVDREIAIAMAHRNDVRALETLCRCMTSATLPAARDLLGVLRPGLGVSSLAVPASRRLLALHAPKPSIADLAVRKAQCEQLLEARREQIRVEIRDAVLQIEEAVARAGATHRRVELARRTAERTERGIELDQQTPGSELTAQLETLERQAELVQKQLAVAEAIVTLHQRQGIAMMAQDMSLAGVSDAH